MLIIRAFYIPGEYCVITYCILVYTYARALSTDSKISYSSPEYKHTVIIIIIEWCVLGRI